MTLEQAINERTSFLKEQINPQNKPIVNRASEIQIETIRNADPEKVAIRILQKQKQLENARDMETIETLYTELEALEWLQRLEETQISGNSNISVSMLEMADANVELHTA